MNLSKVKSRVMDFKYDFHQMHEFLKDLTFILQSGGAANPFKMTTAQKENLAKKLITFFKCLAILIVVCVILYVVYRVVTGGYPMTIYNLLTFSFHHMEDENGILSDNDLLFTNFDYLSNYFDQYDCGNPYDVFDSLYGINTKKTIGSKCKETQSFIETHYSNIQYGQYNKKYRYREKYKAAFGEYFIFFKTLAGGTGKEKVYHFSPKGDNKFVPFTVKNDYFYTILITYLLAIGAINPSNPKKGGNLSQIELIYDMYQNEKILTKNNKPTLFEIRHQTFSNINKISQDLIVAVRKIKELPFHLFLLVPNNEANIKGVVSDISLVSKQLSNFSVYDRKAKELNDYSWYIIEVLSFVQYVNTQKSAYGQISKRFTNLSGYNKNLIISYLNLPPEKRKKAENRILGDIDKNLLENIIKFPIAAKVYYSEDYKNKEILYVGAMRLYIKFMSPKCDHITINSNNIDKLVNNLLHYSKPYKQLITSMLVTNLFLNTYRDNLTTMFQKRYLNTEHFFKELWNPYFDDFFHNRIKQYWKSFANKKHFKGDLYAKFKVFWDKIGDKLKEMTKAVWGAFNQGDDPKQPDPPEEEPPYDKNSYDDGGTKEASKPPVDESQAQQGAQQDIQ